MKHIAQWPLRKPLALFSALLVGAVVVWSLWSGRDVPGNLKDLVQWFSGLALAAYYGTSTMEAVKGVQPKCPSDGG